MVDLNTLFIIYIYDKSIVSELKIEFLPESTFPGKVELPVVNQQEIKKK